MLDFTGILPGYEGVTFRKEKCTGTDKWLYSYQDSYKASKEERDWLRRARKNNTYSLETLREKQKAFGTIVLECDLDLPAEIAYKAYEKRWEIEIVMRYYKSACEFDETRKTKRTQKQVKSCTTKNCFHRRKTQTGTTKGE